MISQGDTAFLDLEAMAALGGGRFALGTEGRVPGVATVLLAACGGGGAPSKFPPRAEGCEVKVFKDAPRLQTENIGTVVAVCDESLSDDECVRQLKDEVCKVGGDRGARRHIR